MKVLVTGGAGYIGSVLVPILLERGHVVRVFDNLAEGGGSMMGFWSRPGFEFVRGDLREAGDVETAAQGMDAVVHLAAIVGDPACAREPDVTQAVNVQGSLAVLENAARAHAQRIIFASTCSNYGRMDDPEAYVDENSELRPVSLYAETKVAIEDAVLDLQGTGIAPTVLRFATLFGVSPRMRFDLTVNEFTMELMTKRKLVVFGEQFWRPYVHVRDAARAIAQVLEAGEPEVSGEVFNVGDTSQNYKKGQLVDLIRAQIEGETEVQHVRRDEDPRDYRVSFEKIQSALGFRITHTVGDGVRQIIDLIDKGVIVDFDSPRYRN